MEIRKYHGRTEGHLRWVGARDTCVSKKLARKKLEQEGLKRNKNQMILREWLRGGSMELPKQSEARGGKDQGRAKKGIG